MSMHAHLHHAKKAKADSCAGFSYWVSFVDESKNNRVTIQCPNEEVARATADAFNDAMAYSSADHEPA
jgi:hypothetical protein